jgi:hypothetical protein
MFFGTQKCDVGLVEKNVEGTCEHTCSFEHVWNFHMHFLDYKILPCHFYLSIHIGYPKPNFQCHVEIKNQNKLKSHTIYSYNVALLISILIHY